MAAIVEEDDRCTYFYLVGASGAPQRSVWVRNHGAAPDALDVERMKEGEAPELPASACLWPNGSPHLDAAKLSLTWFEECTGAALYEDRELLALIPPAPDARLPGFARDCKAPTRLALPLGKASDHPLFASLEKARAFWKRWADEEPWPALEAGFVGAYRAALGVEPTHVETQAVDWPPRLVARFELPDCVVLATGGMSIRPQPGAEGAAPRRIELAIAVDGSFASALEPLARFLAAQTDLPWLSGRYLAAGHGIEGGTTFEALLLCADPPGAPTVALPEADGERVQLLWLVPVTAAERGEKDRAALFARLWASGATFVHRDR